MKKCRTCGEDKPLSEFHRHKATRDGLRHECKSCRSAMLDEWRKSSPAHREYVERNRAKERERQRLNYEQNREEVKARSRAWHAANRDRARETGQRYYAENREKARAAMRAYYERNRDAYIARVAEWAKANPERARKHRKHIDGKRRAVKRSAPYDRIDVVKVFERDKGICGLCSKPVDALSWHLDHIVPLARGGSHTYANVQVAHPRCNQRKGARISER